jgi:beta-fructofuranosidase
VSFEVSSLAKAEPFDPSYANDAQKLCGVMGADVKGGVGPFGLWVLASADLRERTAVFFRVFMDGYGKPKVLVCTDPTKYGQQTAHPIMSSISQKKTHCTFAHIYGDLLRPTQPDIFPSNYELFIVSSRSSLNPDLYKPTFAGFVDTDISSGKISLRSLVNVVLTVQHHFV